MRRSSYICRFRLDGTQKKSHEFLQFNNPTGFVPLSGEGLAYERAVPIQIASGSTYYLQPYPHVAVLGLYNDGGSDAVVNLERVEVFPMNPPTSFSTALLEKLSVYRGDGITVGAGTGDPPALSKLDSASADLPAGVQVLSMAQVNLNGASLLRNLIVPWSTKYTPAGAAAVNATMLASYRGGIGATRGSLSPGEVWDSGIGEPVAQSLIVKPGQQFAVVFNGTYNLSASGILSCMIQLATGEQYVVSNYIGPSLPVGWSPLTILNDSGVDLRVLRMGIQEVTDTDYPFWTLTFIDGLDSGEDADVEKLDSTSRDLPAGVFVRRNANVLRPGGKRGSIGGGINIREILHTNIGGGYVAPLMHNDKFYNFGRYASFGEKLGLREGQGIALVQRTQSGVGMFEVYFRFSVASAREAQGGGVYVS